MVPRSDIGQIGARAPSRPTLEGAIKRTGEGYANNFNAPTAAIITAACSDGPPLECGTTEAPNRASAAENSGDATEAARGGARGAQFFAVSSSYEAADASATAAGAMCRRRTPWSVPGTSPTHRCNDEILCYSKSDDRNIQISAFRAIWASTRGNTTMFQRVFKTHDHIIIIFACTEVKQFLGYAKMVSAPDEGLCPGIWGEFSSRLGDNFRVHWIKQCQLPFSETDNIRNPMNDHLPVRKSRDGMELPLPVGQMLTKTLWGKPDNDLLVGTEWEKSERTVYDLKSWTKGTKPEPVAFRSVAPVGTFDNTNKRPIKDKSDQKSQQEAQQQAQLQQQVQMQMANHQAHQRFRKDQSWPSKPMGGRPPWANDRTWNPSGGAAPSRAPLALTNMMTPSRPPPPSHPMRQLTAAPSTENVWKPPTSGGGGGASSPPQTQTGALPSASNLNGFQPPQRPPMDMVAQQPNSTPAAMGFQPPMTHTIACTKIVNGHMGTQDWRPPPAPWLQRSSEEAWKPPTGISVPAILRAPATAIFTPIRPPAACTSASVKQYAGGE